MSENPPPHLIVVLSNATLETVKQGGKTAKKEKDTSSYQLLNCDDHSHLLKKHGRDATEMRPDITHQVSS